MKQGVGIVIQDWGRAADCCGSRENIFSFGSGSYSTCVQSWLADL
jgi:hypothetical protein